MYSSHYQFGGMHFIWWCVWIILLFWIFASPYNIPGQRLTKETALDILKMRLAAGQIENKEFLEKKELLEGNKN